MNWIFLPASAHAIREVGPLCRSALRNAPSARPVLLLYAKDRRRPELARLARECAGLAWWIAPRLSRRLHGPVLRLAARVGLARRPYARVPRVLRRIVRGCLHITLERFFSALDFLEARMGEEDSLMVSDGRDVILQHDPFALLRNGLVTGQEEKIVRDCPTNAGWLGELYGTGAEAVLPRPILCSGVSLGPRNAMRGYLTAMAEEIWRCFPRIGPRGYFDQAVHNHVIHAQGLAVRASPSREGVIATLGLMDPSVFSWDPGSSRLSVSGKVPAVVHQYDRHPALAGQVGAQYG